MTGRPLSGLDRPFPISGAEASRYGAIVTLENADGRVLVLHRERMPVRACIRECFDAATKLDPSFRIVSVSNPSTIYRDLMGARGTLGDKGADRLSQSVHLPERPMCGGAMLHMLHPRLRGTTDSRNLWRGVDARQGGSK